MSGRGLLTLCQIVSTLFHGETSIPHTKCWLLPESTCVSSGMDTFMFNMDINYNFQSCIILHLCKQQSPDHNKSHSFSRMLCTTTVCHMRNRTSSWWIILTNCHNKNWVGFTITQLLLKASQSQMKFKTLLCSRWTCDISWPSYRRYYTVSCWPVLLYNHLPGKCEGSSSLFFITMATHWNDSSVLFFPFQLKIFSPN
jgi:hypothetical protein